ncbi:GNAT family N-acetyltransferase [Metabacillus sp. RGM 3146]|uniref:GNAT family N-acetyltransferase n=1 Tax=Metabacillus sp. RGM 3146 TaxID=3401092 RepID=UPI003B99C979
MVTLKPMTSDQYGRYLKKAIVHYAEAKTSSGNWTKEEAKENSKKEYEKLLPQGEKTENHFLYTIFKDSKEIGIIWLAKTSQQNGFIYDFQIDEPFQGRGFGKAALKEIETAARNLAIKKLELNVFGYNKAARSLYEKTGYEPMNIRMAKNI